MTEKDDQLIVGRLGAAHGIKGWLRVISYTELPADVFNFSPWSLTFDAKAEADPLLIVEPVEWRLQSKGFVVRLAQIDDRTKAETLKGAEIAVSAHALPDLDAGQYYWRDLIGLSVRLGDQRIGYVERIFDTGANDVMVVRQDSASNEDVSNTAAGRQEWLIPCTEETLVEVNLVTREMTVDWELDADS